METQQSIITSNSPASTTETTAAPVSTTQGEQPKIDVANVASTQNVITETPKTEVANKQPESKVDSKTQSWLDNLSVEVRDNKSISHFKSVEDLAKSYVNLNSLLGKRFNDLTPEELDVYYTKIGRPVSKEGYILPEELEEGTKNWLKDTSFNLGLKQEQTRKIAEELALIARSNKEKLVNERKHLIDSTVDQLKKEFGPAFDSRMNIAKRAVDHFGGDSIKKILDKTGLGNDPEVIKMFSNIGKNLLEDRILESDRKQTFGTTPEEAKQRISKLRQDKEFSKAYTDAFNPKNKEAKDTMNELYAIAYGEYNNQ